MEAKMETKFTEQRIEMKERKAWYVNGYLAALIAVILFLYGAYLIVPSFFGSVVSNMTFVLSGLLWVIAFILVTSITVVAPNEAKALVFFGKYVGSIRTAGLFMTIPFTQKLNVSLKVNNFNSARLKVNDLEGNPIEITAVIVYRVTDSAKVLFEVNGYSEFIAMQSEAALRFVASKYPYDGEEDEVSLRANVAEISEELAKCVQERLLVAGVEVIEARLTHLAYSPEIASAMLQRQQAKSILKAKQLIIEGAVEITQTAIAYFEENEKIELSSNQRLKLVNNLLVAIISDKSAQPVIQADSVDE